MLVYIISNKKDNLNKYIVYFMISSYVFFKAVFASNLYLTVFTKPVLYNSF